MLDCWGGILAGGKSSRFGNNKALQQIDGITFLQKAIELLRPMCDKVLISASGTNAEEYQHLGFDVVQDEEPDLGPLEGIKMLLGHCETEKMFITTCDMPLLTSATLQRMKEAPAHEIICWQDTTGSVFPFPMYISTSCIGEIGRLLRSRQLKVRHLLEQCDSLYLTIDEKETNEFSNINTTNDLNKILWM